MIGIENAMLLGLREPALLAALITPTSWLPIAVIATLLVLAAAALVYMLAPILNSYRMRQWAIFQMYEAVLSLILVFVFLGLVWVVALNPVPALSSVGIVPQGCTTVSGIYALSACDLSQFMNAGYSIADYVYVFSFAGAATPGISLEKTLPSDSGIGLKISTPSFGGAIDSDVLTWVFGGLAIALLLGELQLILIASSVFLFYFLMTVGLISRIFGFSRSFGGAMIALAIGIGILFPLMTAITYGFVDVSANAACLGSYSCSATTALQSTYSGIKLQATCPLALCMINLLGSPSSQGTFGSSLSGVFQEIGYILAGLSIIPIMNIIIVDIFIMDFSRAIGEQMSFQQLFQGLI